MNTRMRILAILFAVTMVITLVIPTGVRMIVSAQEGSTGGSTGPSPDQSDAASTASFPSSGKVTVTYHSDTGKLSFVSAEAGTSIPQPGVLPADATADEAARNFLAAYGSGFGIQDPVNELKVLKESATADGRTFVRYQQVYQGIPVLGGELIVQLDGKKNVLSANGEALPDISLNISPKLNAESASLISMEVVGKKYDLSADALKTSIPELWIYNPGLLGGPGVRQNRLAWRVEVTTLDLQPVRELVLVDAQMGAVLLNFNQIDSALYRTVYDNNNVPTAGLPGTGPVLTEGSSFSSSGDRYRAYEYTGATYNFYWNTHGRDSLNGVGMGLISTVRYCPSVSSCPYANAFWNGTQMVFGQGFASADDVVAHELTHGVTENESHLFYFMQSGAINESLSDVWGEFVDLSYHGTYDNDTAGVRWLLGEDIGAIRSMSNPPTYGDPDRMGSTNYYCGTADGGGVHTNSGVSNKAAFLMTDGGIFNGFTIAGIGITKVAKVYYEAQTHLLTSASDYQDLGAALNQACTNLKGTAGITDSDCGQVEKAVEATEMNNPPACSVSEAPLCSNFMLNSQFNNDATGWVSHWGAWFFDANYLYTNGIEGSTSSASAVTTYGDLDYEVALRRYGSDTNSNGVYVRGEPAPLGSDNYWHSGYLFLYNRSGAFSVFRFDNGEHTALKDWTSSAAIHTGDAWNVLRVAAQGPVFTYYINGVPVWTGTDATYTSGRVGVHMYRGSGSTGDLLQADWATVNGGSVISLFQDDFENPASGKWTRTTNAGSNEWYYPQTANPYNFDSTYGSGAYNLWGYDQDPANNLPSDYSIQMTPFVSIPSGKTVNMHFDHAYEFEQIYDGGVLEFQTSPAGSWNDTAGFFSANGYNGTVSSGYSNPLGGRNAFVQSSSGMTSSRLSLNSLAGQSVRFRFRIGTDASIDNLGWFIDNLKIYTCEAQSYPIYLPAVQNQAPGLALSLHSPFNGNANGWQVNSGIWTSTPIFLVSPGQANVRSSISYPVNYTNVWVQTRMMRNGCVGCANAIILRGTPDPLEPMNFWRSSYLFQYTNTGKYSVFKTVGGASPVALAGWTASNAINASDVGGDYWNVLTVMASGSSLYFYINGALVWSGTDSSLSSGRVGIDMYSEGTWNQLNVDWITVMNFIPLSAPSELGLPETLSPEQAALNAAAGQAGTESPNFSPSR